MNTLYLLTEDDFDSLFYEGCAERITGKTFTPECRRMRKGSGIGAVRASLQIAISEASRMKAGSGAHFLIAMDNDRAPHAASRDALSDTGRTHLAKIDARKTDRHAALVAELEAQFGPERSRWPLPVAVAVPVEMLESWLLMIARVDHASDALPRFARQDSPLARHFHHPAAPPPQLKDRCDAVRLEDGFDNRAGWVLHLLMQRLNAKELASRSPSFALFKAWLDAWPQVQRSL